MVEGFAARQTPVEDRQGDMDKFQSVWETIHALPCGGHGGDFSRSLVQTKRVRGLRRG
jgi:hypothetical protein